MNVGLSVYDVPAPELLDLARAADDAGFDALWLGEHVLLPVGYASEHPTHDVDDHEHIAGPIVSPETELLDPMVALAAVAGATTYIRLATGVYILPLRHPLMTAPIGSDAVRDVRRAASCSAWAPDGSRRSSPRSTCPSTVGPRG